MDISAMDWAAAFPSACAHPDGAAVVLAKVLVELACLARHLGADRVALVIALAVVVFKPAWSETRSLRLFGQLALRRLQPVHALGCPMPRLIRWLGRPGRPYRALT